VVIIIRGRFPGFDLLGPVLGFIIFEVTLMWDIEERIESLLGYRQALDEEDKEVFDMLVGYARELAQDIHC
jgi:hypothetical protein